MLSSFSSLMPLPVSVLDVGKSGASEKEDRWRKGRETA
jgi:hypothetical protein